MVECYLTVSQSLKGNGSSLFTLWKQLYNSPILMQRKQTEEETDVTRYECRWNTVFRIQNPAFPLSSQQSSLRHTMKANCTHVFQANHVCDRISDWNYECDLSSISFPRRKILIAGENELENQFLTPHVNICHVSSNLWFLNNKKMNICLNIFSWPCLWNVFFNSLLTVIRADK